MFVPLLYGANKLMGWVPSAQEMLSFRLNESEHPDINYLRNPVSGVRQLEKFMESVESKLENINVPVLIVQSRNDPVVDFKGTEKVFKSIGSEKKEYFLFDYDRHGILMGDDVKRIYSAIRNFLESV